VINRVPRTASSLYPVKPAFVYAIGDAARRVLKMRRPAFATPALMNLSRFESFSDAVFAIAVTLLVLNFRIPDLPGTAGDGEIIRRLLSLWPDFLGYVTSFIVIGVLWVNHHALFHFLRCVDRYSLVINLLLLMCVAFIPFPTALIARYGGVVPVVILFGLTMALTGILFSALWIYAVRRYPIAATQIDTRFVRDASIWTVGYPAAYLAATAISLVSTKASLALYVAIPILYLFPGVIDRQLHSDMYERRYGTSRQARRGRRRGVASRHGCDSDIDASRNNAAPDNTTSLVAIGQAPRRGP
jgi:uncharacterized membrane protein